MNHRVLMADTKKHVGLAGFGDKREVGLCSPIAYYRKMRDAGNDLEVIAAVAAREDLCGRDALNRSSERSEERVVSFLARPAGQRG